MPLFDPPIWHPLFQFLRDELFPLLGGGGGAMIINPHQFFFTDNSYFVTGHQGKFILSGSEGHPYLFAMAQYEDGDEWEHPVLLKAGQDYAGEMLTIAGPSGGIMELRLGTLVLQTFDFYEASPNYNLNYQFSIAGTDIPTDGLYLLRGVTTGKNVASSSYENFITKVNLRPYVV